MKHIGKHDYNTDMYCLEYINRPISHNPLLSGHYFPCVKWLSLHSDMEPHGEKNIETSPTSVSGQPPISKVRIAHVWLMTTHLYLYH